MTGQFMLEQTYLLPVSAMARPDLSPQRVLGVCQGSWNLIHAASNTGSVSCSC